MDRHTSLFLLSSVTSALNFILLWYGGRLEYDSNYFVFLITAGVSILLGIVIFIAVQKLRFSRSEKVVTFLVYLLLGSPFTIVFIIFNYELLFDFPLKG